MSKVLVLGGGFGGISAACSLRPALPPTDEIILVSGTDRFMMGFRKNSIVAGGDAEVRNLAALEARGITVRIGPITKIDPKAISAEVAGETISADAMVVALGADLAPVAVPGLADHGINVYSSEGARQAQSALGSLTSGRVVIGVFGAPYKCPPAPFELALLLHDVARERNAQWKLTVFSPLPMSIPALGAAGCNPLETKLFSEGIEFRASTKVASVESDRVVLADGAGAIPFDLLLAVPPHRVPKVCVEAGLAAEGGWVKANPRTLETAFPKVFALGDSIGVPLSNGTALPKAGAIADREAQVAAARIVDLLAGAEPSAQFDGQGDCFLEIGGGQAMLVRGAFFEDPPRVELSSPSADALATKNDYERARLAEWFGAP